MACDIEETFNGADSATLGVDQTWTQRAYCEATDPFFNEYFQTYDWLQVVGNKAAMVRPTEASLGGRHWRRAGAYANCETDLTPDNDMEVSALIYGLDHMGSGADDFQSMSFALMARCGYYDMASTSRTDSSGPFGSSESLGPRGRQGWQWWVNAHRLTPTDPTRWYSQLAVTPELGDPAASDWIPTFGIARAGFADGVPAAGIPLSNGLRISLRVVGSGRSTRVIAKIGNTVVFSLDNRDVRQFVNAFHGGSFLSTQYGDGAFDLDALPSGSKAGIYMDAQYYDADFPLSKAWTSAMDGVVAMENFCVNHVSGPVIAAQPASYRTMVNQAKPLQLYPK